MEMQPTHRAFVTVELPFRVSPPHLLSTTEQAAQRRAIEVFAPPAFIQPSLRELNHNNNTAGPTLPRTFAFTNNDGSSSSSSSDDDASSSSSGSQANNNNNNVDVVRTLPTQASDAPPACRYEAGHIFSAWRSTNWEGEDVCARMSDFQSAALIGNNRAAEVAEQWRRDLFPSTEPQMLLQGYCRNDVLLRVRQRKRYRQLRDSATGEVVQRELLAHDEDVAVASSSSSAAEPEVQVVGVVSREVELARPADFSFALLSKDLAVRAPELCSRDVLPPTRYLSQRAPVEARYEMGRARNTSITTNNNNSNSSLTAPDAGVGEPSPTQWELSAMPSVLISPESETIPPAPLAAHRDFLELIGASPDGRTPRESDPAEVRVLRRLLEERPLWSMTRLSEAMWRSGRCPRAHLNKQVIQCLTYVVTNGPFNRLRIRFGYNPYASSASVVYQRISFRIARRSDVGVRLRDVSRSPYIAAAIKTVLEEEAKRASGAQVGPTLTECLCRTIAGGCLHASVQVAEVLDDEVVQSMVKHIETGTDMDVSRRRLPQGWFRSGTHKQLLSHFLEKLGSLLMDRLVPLLQAAENGASVGQRRTAVDEEEAGSSDGVASNVASSGGSSMSEDDRGLMGEEEEHHAT